jgi:DNA-binding NarL/FixJ family response regulator
LGRIARSRAPLVSIESAKDTRAHLGLVWIDCSQPVAAAGLARILETAAHVHVSREPPEGTPAFSILGADDASSYLEGIKRRSRLYPDSQIVVFNWGLDLALARTVLRAGARAYIHAGMEPEQIVRALSVVAEGQIAAPRQLLEYLVANDRPLELEGLSARQKEILELVGEGLSNTQIAERLFISESTVKQHLRAAYKVLGVSNRTEAAKLAFNG